MPSLTSENEQSHIETLNIFAVYFLPDYHRVTINRTERNAYIPFGKLAGLEYVYSFLAFSASVTSKKEIKQHEKRTGYFNNKQQSDGGERHEE